MLNTFWPDTTQQVLQCGLGMDMNTSPIVHTKTLHLPSSSSLPSHPKAEPRIYSSRVNRDTTVLTVTIQSSYCVHSDEFNLSIFTAVLLMREFREINPPEVRQQISEDSQLRDSDSRHVAFPSYHSFPSPTAKDLGSRRGFQC